LIHSLVLYEGVDVKHGAYVRNSGRRRLDGAAAVSLEGSTPVNMKTAFCVGSKAVHLLGRKRRVWASWSVRLHDNKHFTPKCRYL